MERGRRLAAQAGLNGARHVPALRHRHGRQAFERFTGLVAEACEVAYDEDLRMPWQRKIGAGNQSAGLVQGRAGAVRNDFPQRGGAYTRRPKHRLRRHAFHRIPFLNSDARTVQIGDLGMRAHMYAEPQQVALRLG